MLDLVKSVRIHKKVSKEFERLDFSLRRKLTELFALLAEGENLGLPISRPMPVIDHGAHELKIKDRSGQYRIFYFTKKADVILIFHFLKKKTQENSPARN